MGFVAARWRRADDLEHLDEWGLGGRNFGAWITWFLLGGDLYTAYTFVAVPALLFGAGAIGFFAVPYTIIVYPMVFLVLIRLWSVSHVHGFVTPADFVRARFGSSTLALLVAITGIVATMPYIALQLVGIEAVLKAMGVTGHLPIIVAFAILAAYTYSSGLRAPALIAFVKDTLIYLVIIVAIIVHPVQARRLGRDLRRRGEEVRRVAEPRRRHHPRRPGQLQYVTLALGSALALFLYPHSVTGVLAPARPQRDQAQHGRAAGVQLPARPARAARLHGDRGRRGADHQRQRQAGQQHRSCRCCSTRCSRAGSPASRSPPSASARWSRPRSCRSRRRTC